MWRYSIIVMSMIILVIASCKKNQTTTTPTILPPDVPGPVIQIDSFPLRVGNQWVYKIVGDTNTFILTAVSDTVIDIIRLTRLSGNGPVFTLASDDCYYANLDDGTYQFENLNYVDTIIKQKSDIILKLPANIGDSWNIFVGNRTWVHYVTVTTPAGKFDCIQMKYYGTNGGGDYFYITQYYSYKGLIKEIYSYTTQSGPGGHSSSTNSYTILLQSTNF